MKSYNLYEFVNLVRKVAEAHPLITTFHEGVYSLDASRDIKYPVIALTIGSVEYGSQTSDLVFNLLYADRLTKDAANRLQVQSVGVETVAEFVNALRNNFDMDIEDSLVIRPYTGQFADDCAGASCENIRMTFPSNIGSCDWICEIDECN